MDAEDIEYTIETIKIKLLEVRKKYSDVVCKITNKALKDEKVTKEELAYQKLLKGQYTTINSLHNEMNKSDKAGDKGKDLSYFFKSLKEIEIGMSKLQQNIN